MPQAIIISPYFPPSTLAGVHRARHLAKHLPAHGWQPIVLCVHEDFHEQRLDPDLARLVPSDREIVKVPAIPARFTRPFGIGEISLRAWRPLKKALFRLLAERPIDAVLITGAPFYPMLLARSIKQHFNVPVVLDFQDPWVSQWGAQQPVFSKAGVAHRLACWLEPRAVRHADFITSVSEEQNRQMAERYPWLDKSRMAAIPIGGDPEDFEALRAMDPMPGAQHLAAGKINISYVGSYWSAMDKPLRVFFAALSKALQNDPRLPEKVRFNFIGTDATLTTRPTHRILPIAEQEGGAQLLRLIHEIPQRLPFLEALGVMARSDILLLIGSDEPHYTASKIYPALMSGRPHISLFHAKSSAHAILTQAGGGLHFSFSNDQELLALPKLISFHIYNFFENIHKMTYPKKEAWDSFSAYQIAKVYADILGGIHDQTQHT